MDSNEHTSPNPGPEPQHVLTDSSDRNVAIISGGAFAAVLIALVTVAVVVRGDISTWLYVPPAGLTVALAVVAYIKVRVWAGWGNPQLFLPSSEPLHLGDHVTARFRRLARGVADTDGVQVSAWIEVEEVTAGPGGQRHVERVYESPAEVTLLNVIGLTVEADLSIDIPLSEAPPSLELSANEVRWKLTVRIEAPNAPDDDSFFPLTVAPVVARGSQVTEGSQ